jgi:hypothetical protein
LAFFFCENCDFLPPANLDHGGGGGILAEVQLRYRQLSATILYPRAKVF